MRPSVRSAAPMWTCRAGSAAFTEFPPTSHPKTATGPPRRRRRNDGNFLGALAVGDVYNAARRSAGVYQTLELKSGEDILQLAVAIAGGNLRIEVLEAGG